MLLNSLLSLRYIKYKRYLRWTCLNISMSIWATNPTKYVLKLSYLAFTSRLVKSWNSTPSCDAPGQKTFFYLHKNVGNRLWICIYFNITNSTIILLGLIAYSCFFLWMNNFPVDVQGSSRPFLKDVFKLCVQAGDDEKWAFCS